MPGMAPIPEVEDANRRGRIQEQESHSSKGNMTTARQTFGQVSSGRDNNFDFLRFFLAAMVIFAHTYHFLYTGPMQYDPLVRLTSQVGIGGLAVNCFFLISGFLITRSWIASKGVKDYIIKRALRIFPALIAALLFCIFVIGPIGTVLPLATYFRHPNTYRYLGFMLHVSLKRVDRLPGLFMSNPWTERVNGSLWTIRQEILCYVVVALLGLLRMYRRPVVVLALTSGVYLLYLQGTHLAENGISDFFRLLTYFLLGMLLYLYRDCIPYSRNWMLAALLVIVVTTRLGCLAFFLPVCAAYVLFYTAFNTHIRLQHFAKHGDLSYGVYLYAFPVQQLLVVYFRNSLNVFTLFASALAISCGLAALSWRFVEKPFLKLKPRPRMTQAENVIPVQEEIRLQSVAETEISSKRV